MGYAIGMSDDIKKDFEGLIGSKRLGHGYIFHGEDSSAQFEFAKGLAHFLERGSWEVSEKPLSDINIVDEGVGVIGINIARDAQRFLYQAPNESSHRVVVVNNAGKLNHLAQNALLKIAEEY